jgi:uncharacterized protein (TIGR02145 family)
MKNLYTTLFLLSFGLIANLSAQTLKNIHRHNQPVLRIPTNLIDKVETAEVNGAQVLQVRQLNGYVSEIPLSQIDSITHSDGEAVDPAQLGILRTASVTGVVRDQNNEPLFDCIVRSPYGGEETRTDPNGVFLLSNILVYDKLGYITITKPGFHQGSRSFLPLETGSNRVNVQLLPMTQSGTFTASSGGTVTSGSLQLNFPANAIQQNGQPYSGAVNVYVQTLDPTSPAMVDQMPGDLLGVLNDSMSILRSFGMMSVELRDANMNELQLATGVSATLTFNIPTALQAEAPATIDWWSFDEDQGLWMHEGVAQKQGTQYIGQASHFSWWNLDVPNTFNNMTLTVVSSKGDLVSGAKVELVSPTMGKITRYTNANGVISGRVPKNQDLELRIYLICSVTNDWTLATSGTIVSFDADIDESFQAELFNYEFYPISGTVVNCQNQPVASGYVKMGPQVYLTNEAGQFTIQTCAVGDYVIRGYDTSIADSIKASALDTVQVGTEGINIGDLQACSQFFGAVSDIEGHIYQTVLIGSQFWMAENLRSATYANGEPIANVTDNTAWAQLSTGAWCHYNNNTTNDSIYGKLYNWYTTVDPRGLCPAGWHVPTDAEWTDLTDYLGGETVAGGKMKSSGTQYWNSPNTAATNESGFSGFPGAFRSDIDGNSYDFGTSGYWWSSTEEGADYAYHRNLNYNDGDASSYGVHDQCGFSVRCLKD